MKMGMIGLREPVEVQTILKGRELTIWLTYRMTSAALGGIARTDGAILCPRPMNVMIEGVGLLKVSKGREGQFRLDLKEGQVYDVYADAGIQVTVQTQMYLQNAFADRSGSVPVDVLSTQAYQVHPGAYNFVSDQDSLEAIEALQGGETQVCWKSGFKVSG